MTDASMWIKILTVAGITVTAYVLALWVAMIVWTYRDARSRMVHPITRVGATAVVAFFNIPGLLLYLAVRPPESLADTYNRQLEARAFLHDIEKEDICASCQRAIQTSFIACPYCRAKLQEPCDDCGRSLKEAWTICPYCTAPRGRTPVAAPTAPRRAVPATGRGLPVAAISLGDRMPDPARKQAQQLV